MNSLSSYRIFPLGDTAITVDFGNIIDEETNKKVLTAFYHCRQRLLPGMTEVAPAYSSLTFYYNVATIKKRIAKDKTAYEWVKEQVEQLLMETGNTVEENSKLLRIPVCYDQELAPGSAQLATRNNITVEEMIRLHQSRIYRVYMLGFLPGFPYMGRVDEKISMPRKSTPENVAAGSVGIAGYQTGIYPLDSPGGWYIIGRTPLRLFDAEREDPVLLEAGDKVQFYSISRHEFENY